jgi:hypothetical protein
LFFSHSQWIKKQIHKECVLPNMHDLCMKWCNNPFEKDDLLLLKRSHINNLLWFSENDSELLIKKIYLIAQWKQNDLFRFHKKSLFIR